MNMTMPSIGEHLRDWRQRRRRSQMDLALDAEISSRHLSFVETGRARPSRELLLKLADCLKVPTRERNTWLLAAGFAPVYAERPLTHPDLAAARATIELILAGHEPFPALAVDRHWNVVMANRGAEAMMTPADPALLAPPLNILRLSLHPRGMAPKIVNYAQIRAHILHRLQQQIELSGDPALAALREELAAYPPPPARSDDAASTAADLGVVAVPLRLDVGGRVLSFISTITIFGTPVDVTLSELAIESFFPADAFTAEAVRSLSRAG